MNLIPSESWNEVGLFFGMISMGEWVDGGMSAVVEIIIGLEL